MHLPLRTRQRLRIRRDADHRCTARQRTEKVAQFGHDRLCTFGIGAELSEAEWRLLLRHLVAQHIVEVDHATFNVLRLTDASRAVLRGERTIELRHQVAQPRRRQEQAASEPVQRPTSDDPIVRNSCASGAQR